MGKHLAPTSKMAATGTAGAAGLVLVWLLQQFGIEMPEPVAAGIVLGIAWLAGYIKTERRAAGKPNAAG